MRGKWRWLLYAFLLWEVARTAFLAFSVPWRWTADQYLFVFFLLCAGSVLVLWGTVWWRGGMAAVKERWALRQQVTGAPISKKVLLWAFVFWIVVALALVLFFNARQS